MKTNSVINIYEVNGEDVSGGDDAPKLEVKSHWNRRNLVVLSFGGKEITVPADELLRAIRNAENAHRF